MWYSLPVKDRIALMKDYKKAYPDMGYHDMVKHFNNGGELPFGPIKEQNPYLVPEYNQPKANGYILPDPNRPNLEGYDASEYKQSWDTGTPNEIQIPSIVGGQYLGNRAMERYAITGDTFKPMTDPSSYSKFYNEVGKLGLMKKKYPNGGELEKPTTYQQLYGTPKLNLSQQQIQNTINEGKKNEVERRKQLIKKRPDLYSVEDYKKGISEPGIQESISPLDLLGPAEIKAAMNLVKSGAKSLPKAATKAGEYLTTQTPLKNAYKYNPFAFKPNPEAYYRMIGQEGYIDALESGLLRSNPGKGGLQTQQFDDVYFSMKHPWDGRNYGYVTKSGEPIGGVGYKGPYMAELTGQELNHPISSFPRANMAQSKVPISLENPGLKLYKQDWLRGYKEVSK